MLFDLSSNPVRGAIISKAILTKLPSATPRLMLSVANLNVGSQYGLQVYCPVFQALPCPTNSSQTCRQPAGLSMAVFAITDLVRKSQRGLVEQDSALRGDEFLLDLGPAVGPDGFLGARLFLPGSDCAQHANYSLAFGVDELHASTNASASAPSVRARLAQVLPAVCDAVQSSPGLAAAVQAQVAAANANGAAEVTFTGFDHHGAFYVKTFLVADRRWAFLIHTQASAYRALLSTNSPPIVLAGGILLAAVLLGGSLGFRKLQHQIRRNAFILAFRASKPGDKATQQHLPPKLQTDYVAEEVVGGGGGARVVRAKRRHGGEGVDVKLVVSEGAVFSPVEKRQLRREELALMALSSEGCESAAQLAGVGTVQLGWGIGWFVMELLAGPNLEAVVRDPAQGPLGESDCMDVARRVLAVLKRLHGGGVVHRDIKPANIVRCGRADGAGGSATDAKSRQVSWVRDGVGWEMGREAICLLSPSHPPPPFPPSPSLSLPLPPSPPSLSLFLSSSLPLPLSLPLSLFLSPSLPLSLSPSLLTLTLSLSLPLPPSLPADPWDR
jgi:hypothetical protein